MTSAIALRSQNVPATASQLGKFLAALAASFKWPSQDVIADQKAFVVGMRRALERERFSISVLNEIHARLLAGEQWIPDAATAVRIGRKICTEVLAKERERRWEAEREARQRQRETEAFEAAIKEFNSRFAGKADFARACANIRRIFGANELLLWLEDGQYTTADVQLWSSWHEAKADAYLRRLWVDDEFRATHIEAAQNDMSIERLITAQARALPTPLSRPALPWPAMQIGLPATPPKHPLRRQRGER